MSATESHALEKSEIMLTIDQAAPWSGAGFSLFQIAEIGWARRFSLLRRPRREGSGGRGRPKRRKPLRGGMERRKVQRAIFDRVGDASGDKIPCDSRALLPSVDHERVASPIERA